MGEKGKMKYILTYVLEDSEERLALLEAKDYYSAECKAREILRKLSISSRRTYCFIELQSLNEIKKLDALAD
ncbi:hypothetical protein DCC39_13175 [Pueribacillus theae]|uniref:Uncharacterized protein n=1 Tax=Pueribacillus theae TaxID=2171751 RepID=A0A2U1JWS5_9BACI|nr:hypothetical protein [Pueribacillus theae]PWA09445.1 hypothetical protein DCC39_13175 [Pueribacillus theae]